MVTLQRISGLEDLQTQVNQVKVNMGMPRYTSMKDDPSEGYDTGFASWDDPTPSQSGNPRATTNEGRRSPGNNTGMGTIQEGNETKRTNSQSSLRNQKQKSPTPSQGRNKTPSQDKNKTPSQSRNQTPTGDQNKTPSQSRNQTPTGNQSTGRKSATKKDGSATPVSLSNV